MRARTKSSAVGAVSKHCITLAVCIPLLAAGVRAIAETDPLPSWNDGAAKKAIVEFVHATTDKASPKFVPPEERIATFDQDGTLWVSHPIYTQVVYCLGRVPAVVKAKPELTKVEPFKTVLSGNREAMARLPMADLVKILAATLTGMSVDQFEAEVKNWLATARDPRWTRPYTELTYVPMIELLKYLRANGFKTYIVTGSADARVHDGRRRRAPRDAGAARRREARVRLRPGPGPPRHEGGYLHAGALRRGEQEGLDRDQHAERLEAYLLLR